MANVKATAETVKNVAAKKVEEVMEAVKPVAKAAEAKKEEVKKEEVKPEAEKAAPAKKEEAAPAKEVKETKKPGRKAGSKNKTTKAAKTVKKEENVTEVYVQYGPNGEASVDAVVDRIKNEYVAQGHRASSIKSLKVYLKPEERSAYYVLNDKIQGRVDLF